MPLHIFICDDWFYYKRKGLQKLLENAIGILEKEKKMEILFFLNFWPEGLLPLLLISTCSAFSPPQPSMPLARFTSRKPSSSSASRNGRPSSRPAEAVAPFLLSVSLPPWGHLSASPSSSSSHA
jgi:hypothetical protein